MTTSAIRRDRILASPQFRDGRFHNTSGATADLEGNTLPVMRDFFFGGRGRKPRITIPVENPLPVWATPASSGLRMTWLGHSTLIIEIDGVRVLTDPVFGSRASPFAFAGPKRFHPVPAPIAQLPPLDAVLLSHDHHDHLDPSSIRELARMRVPFVTSLGVGERLERLGVEPGADHRARLVGDAHARAAAPSRSRQHPRSISLGAGCSIETGRRSGLRSCSRHTRAVSISPPTPGSPTSCSEIGRRYGPFDVSMIEIGAWHPAWGSIHLGPANALLALRHARRRNVAAHPLGDVRPRPSPVGRTHRNADVARRARALA